MRKEEERLVQDCERVQKFSFSFFHLCIHTHTHTHQSLTLQMRETQDGKNDDREAHDTIKFLIEENPVPTFSFSYWVRTSPSFFSNKLQMIGARLLSSAYAEIRWETGSIDWIIMINNTKQKKPPHFFSFFWFVCSSLWTCTCMYM